MNARTTMQRMMEATRLTRAGNLNEATALLKDVFSGGAAQGAAPASPAAAGVATRIAESFAGALKPAAVDTPAGARFTEQTYTDAHGQRAYKLFVPSGYDGSPVPLVVMLHGCTQSPDDFAAGTRMNELAEEKTILVAYPAQPKSANPSKCWNWFSEADQKRENGEPALIAGITREITRTHAVDPARVFVAGLSAGGALAAIMGMTYPDLYAAVGIHSGLACGAANSLPSALAAMHKGSVAALPDRKAGSHAPRAVVFHGTVDKTVVSRNADQVVAQFAGPTKLTAEIRDGRVPGGLAYTIETYVDAEGTALIEKWLIEGAAHAWAGGSPTGTYTDPRGPDASREMLRFFLAP